MSNVKPTQERMVFSVASDRNAGKNYRVDLTAENGAGRCSCRDWETRRGPALRQGATTWTTLSTCKHQRAAANFFLRDLLKAMAASEGER